MREPLNVPVGKKDIVPAAVWSIHCIAAVPPQNAAGKIRGAPFIGRVYIISAPKVQGPVIQNDKFCMIVVLSRLRKMLPGLLSSSLSLLPAWKL